MSYGKLNFTNTVLSKRKLGKLVESRLVSGWDDPRMPTVRGVLRSGMQIEPLIAYITTQILSKVPVTLEWSKIWSYNSSYLNDKALRLYGIGPNVIEVKIEGPLPNSVNVPNHPNNPEKGYRTLAVSNMLYVDAEDFPYLTDAQKASENLLNKRYTLVNLGNATVTKVDPLTLRYDPNDKDFKNTMKVTWLAKDNASSSSSSQHNSSGSADNISNTTINGSGFQRVIAKKFGTLLVQPKLEDNEDIIDIFNRNSETTHEILIENTILNIQPGETFQIMRKGYYYLDRLENGKIILHGPTP